MLPPSAKISVPALIPFVLSSSSDELLSNGALPAPPDDTFSGAPPPDVTFISPPESFTKVSACMPSFVAVILKRPDSI